VPAPRSFVRPFISDHTLLQREAKTKDPALAFSAYAIIGLCTLLLLAVCAYALHRIRVTSSPGAYRAAPDPSRQSLLATPPAA
jgi:hypothetical protein